MSGFAPAGWPARISLRSHDHDVRTGLDPVVVGGRLGRIGIGVAGVGTALEHVHQPDGVGRRRLVMGPRLDPLACIRIEAHRIRARRCRSVRHAGPSVGALAQGGHLTFGIDGHDRRIMSDRGGRSQFGAGDRVRGSGCGGVLGLGGRRSAAIGRPVAGDEHDQAR